MTFPIMAVLSTILYGNLVDLNMIVSLGLSLLSGLATITLIYIYPVLGANFAHWQMSKELTTDLETVPFGLDKPLDLDKNELPSVSSSPLPKGKTA